MISWDVVRVAIKSAKADHAEQAGAGIRKAQKIFQIEPTRAEIGDTLIKIIVQMEATRLERQFVEIMQYHRVGHLL